MNEEPLDPNLEELMGQSPEAPVGEIWEFEAAAARTRHEDLRHRVEDLQEAQDCLLRV